MGGVHEEQNVKIIITDTKRCLTIMSGVFFSVGRGFEQKEEIITTEADD